MTFVLKVFQFLLKNHLISNYIGILISIETANHRIIKNKTLAEKVKKAESYPSFYRFCNTDNPDM